MTDAGSRTPILIITGPPAAGKTVCARRLAERRPRCAMIDVDDIRQLVVAGHAAPWEGTEGAAQHRLGVENACRLARSLAAYGLAVVLTDVVTDAVRPVYAELLPGAVLVHLRISAAEAGRRSDSRVRHLAELESRRLWQEDRDTRHPGAHELAVDGLTIAGQVEALEDLWLRGVSG